MEEQKTPIRYIKPCLTDLPPELGRQIFEEIRTAKPRMTKEEREKRANRILKRIGKNIDKKLAELKKEKENKEDFVGTIR